MQKYLITQPRDLGILRKLLIKTNSNNKQKENEDKMVMVNLWCLSFLFLYLFLQISLNESSNQMFISNFCGSIMNNTPRRKMTRFSEHPQIFQYSSKSKKDQDLDNDSLLLDNYQDAMTTNQNNPVNENKIDFQKKQFQLDQLTSELAEIEAYLNNDSTPVQSVQIQDNFTPIKKQEKASRISFGYQNRPRLSFNIRNQLNNGRQTMNIQQQTKLKSQLKSISRSREKTSNQNFDVSVQKNRRCNQNIVTEQHKSTEQERDQSNIVRDSKDAVTKNIDEKIKQQIQKKKRITMDASHLIDQARIYEREQNIQKYRQSRSNRITLDFFAIQKMLEGQKKDQPIEQDMQMQDLRTPAKNQPEIRPKYIDKEGSFRKSKIFSGLKLKSSNEQTISRQILKYMEQISERVTEREKDIGKIQQQLNQLTNQLNKSRIRIQNHKSNIYQNSKDIKQKQQYKRKLLTLIEQSNYQEQELRIEYIQHKYGFRILKYERRQQQKESKNDTHHRLMSIAHFDFNGIYVKLKARSHIDIKNNEVVKIDLKILSSRQCNQCWNYFLFNLESFIGILKKYHSLYLSDQITQHKSNNYISNRKLSNLLNIGIQLNKLMDKIKNLDTDLQYFSLNFKSEAFQLSPSYDILTFNTTYGNSFSVAFQINLISYLHDIFDQNSVKVYDMKNHNYMKFNANCKQSSNLQSGDSLLFTIIKELILRYC